MRLSISRLEYQDSSLEKSYRDWKECTAQRDSNICHSTILVTGIWVFTYRTATIDYAPVCDIKSRVDKVMVAKFIVHAIENAVDLFMHASVVLKKTPFFFLPRSCKRGCTIH